MLGVYWSTTLAICVTLAGVTGDKIIDGKEVKPHSRPYMAFLHIGKGDLICGGFLIHPNFILTAAHCQSQNINVLLGAHDFSKNEKSQQVIPVETIIPHKCFDNLTLANDIMLLKLKNRANITHAVKTIRIPKRDEDFSVCKCSVAGWGDTKTNGNSNSVLREVKVRVDFLSTTHIFERGPGIVGACYGDSGGPLACHGILNMPTAVGIVSYALKGCDDPQSIAYVRVSAYWDWIQMTIKKYSTA
ncbi:granzyme-like protein 1 [Polypterus senegalus]|nr:granzyme-like protein 1 [Polypterus senegalus]